MCLDADQYIGIGPRLATSEEQSIAVLEPIIAMNPATLNAILSNHRVGPTGYGLFEEIAREAEPMMSR